ncbi:MAG: hypothetical protein J6P84_00140 [Alphaproteobacteria bacterium]|nr:hypothetical protein [Alphaproteobacteria bacterium]MBO7551605.1 hypothetical protein [Fibrobacter sp.]
MSIADLIINLYGSLYNRKRIPIFVFSPFRYVLRIAANKILPMIYNKSISPSRKNQLQNDKIIVSLTSFPARIDSVWLVIESMLRQTIVPYKIILWLSKDQFESVECLPESLKKRQNDIFEIKLVEGDFRSHKKYLYAFINFPDNPVITVDDDIFYPSTLIESLYKQHLKTPNDIVCRYARRIKYDLNGFRLPYSQWSDRYDYIGSDVFFGSGGGTLFVPNKLFKDVTNVKLSMKLCPLADDVWLNAMVRLNGLSVVPVTRNLILPIFSKSNESLSSVNVLQDFNDVQINNIINHYKKDLFGR